MQQPAYGSAQQGTVQQPTYGGAQWAGQQAQSGGVNPFGGPTTSPPAAQQSGGASQFGGPASSASQPFGGASPGTGQQSFGAGTPQAVFGAAAPTGDLVAAKPPTWLLFLAGGLALVAGILAIVFANPILAIVCWLVAGPVAIGLLAWFVVKDTFARSSGLYAAPSWVKPMHYAAIGVCLLCILAPALRIADWVGHL